MTNGHAYDDQGLPWLEAVEDECDAPAISGRKMAAALAMVVAAALLVAGTFFWMGRGDPDVAGAPALIKAEPGPYKVKPDDPGGLDIAGDSETAFATGAGEDTDAALAGEAPAVVAEPDPTTAPKVAESKPEPKVEKPAAPPEAAPVAGGPTIQLGAYASTIKAETAWSMLSSRFPAVAGMSKQVVGATVGGKTIYRLRATGSSAQASAACSALRAAGESCLVVK